MERNQETLKLNVPYEASHVLPEIPGYEFRSEIARGGMGIVYRAWHEHLGREVALKTILPGIFAGKEERRRFQVEAEAAASLDHPNIVTVHEIGEANGVQYFSMRLIEGESLSARGGRAQDPLWAARILATVARAIDHAHRRGVLHRDLKPANILLDGEGRPHVADFGLARRIGGGGATLSGAILGTPAYMSPEQASGRVDDLTTATDVYGLGAILYQLLTGRPPFAAETPLATLLLVQQEAPRPPRSIRPDLDRDLESICLSCLEKDPGRRYGSAAALALDLERYLRGESISVRIAGPLERAGRWIRRRPLVAGLLALVCLTATAGVGGIVHQWRRAEGERREAIEAKQVAQQSARQAVEEATAAEAARREAVRLGEELADALYPADLQISRLAWREGAFQRAIEILDRHAGEAERHGIEWHLLQRQFHEEVASIPAEGAAGPIAFEPGGDRLAIGHADGSISLVDGVSGRPIHRISLPLPPGAGLIALAYEPDGRRLVAIAVAEDPEGAGAADVSPSLPEFLAGRLLRAAVDPSGRIVEAPAPLSADGIPLGLSFSLLGAIGRFTLEGQTLAALSIARTAEGFLVVGVQTTEGEPRTGLAFLNLESGERRVVLRTSEGFPALLGVLGDGVARIALANPLYQTLSIWDAGSDEWTEKGPVKVLSMTAHPRIGALFLGCFDGRIRIDRPDGASLLEGHGGPVIGLAVSAAGERLASIGADDVVRIWDLTRRPWVRDLEVAGPQEIVMGFGIPGIAYEGQGGLAFLPGQDEVLAVDGRGFVARWDGRTGQPRGPVERIGDGGHRAAFSPRADRAALASGDGRVDVLDVSTDRLVARLECRTESIRHVALSPDGLRAAAVSYESMGRIPTIHLFDVESRRLLACAQGEKTGVVVQVPIAFSPDGETLAAVLPSCVLLLEAGGGGPRSIELPTGAGEAGSASFAGKLLAISHSTNSGSSLRLLDVESGTILLALEGIGPIVTAVAGTPDGRRLIWSGVDRSSETGFVRVVSVPDGTELLHLDVPGGPLLLAVDESGRRLACAWAQFDMEDERTPGSRIRVWDATP